MRFRQYEEMVSCCILCKQRHLSAAVLDPAKRRRSIAARECRRAVLRTSVLCCSAYAKADCSVVDVRIGVRGADEEGFSCSASHRFLDLSSLVSSLHAG